MQHVAAPYCSVCRSWHPRTCSNAIYSSPHTRNEGCYKVWEDSQRLNDMGAARFWANSDSPRLWDSLNVERNYPFTFAIALAQAAIPIRSNPRDASTCGSSEGPSRPDDRTPPSAGAASVSLPSAILADSPAASPDPSYGSLHGSGVKSDSDGQHHDADARSPSPLRREARLRPSRIGPYWGRRLRSSGTTVGN